MDTVNNKIYIGDYGTSLITKFDQTFLSGTINATLKFAPPELILSSNLNLKVTNINYYKLDELF